MRRTRLVFALVLTLFGGCLCAPQVASVELGEVGVQLDGPAGSLTLVGATGDLLTLDLLSLGSGEGEAVFEMQFGMFDIQPTQQPQWRSPETVEVTEASAERVAANLMATGERIGTLVVEPQGERGVTLRVSFAAASDDSPAPNRQRMSYDCAPDDHFVGFGAQTHDVDHRGQIIP